jgi:hypothetical protein
MEQRADSGAGDHDRVRRIVLDSLEVIEHAVKLVAVDVGVGHVGFSRDFLDGVEASMLADKVAEGASDRQVTATVSAGAKTSKRQASKRAKRAKVVHANPGVGSKMRSGELSGDHVDVIADAAEKTDGAAAIDEKLIDDVASVNPDQARKIAAKYVAAHTTNDDVQSEYDRARRRRCVRRYSTDRGTDVLHVEGASQDIDEIEATLRRVADQLYRADGGRDTSAAKHPRTRDQRAFDAAHQLLTGAVASANGEGGSGSTSFGPRGSSRSATFFITATIDQFTGADDTPLDWIGSGPLPPTMVEYLACNGEFIGQIYNQVGDILWQGRAVRDATPAQIKALIARDQGCVACGAHHSLCEAHHLVPWNAPTRGRTDVDKLALVCKPCHIRIHEQKQTLYRDSKGRWQLRNATVDEIAPDRPANGRTRVQPDDQPTPDAKPRTGKPKLHQRPRTGALF